MAKKKVIISIDGGGIRGILPLIILQKIFQYEDEFNPELEIEWWGTSAGALISSSICLNRVDGATYFEGAQNTLDFFELRSSGLIPHQEQRIDNRAFNLLMNKIFGAYSLQDFDNLNIVSTAIESLKSVVFSNENIPLSEALKASCAVPGLFPPVIIGDRRYIDGYVSAKNPTKLALQKAPKDLDLVLSFGTGKLSMVDEVENYVQEVHQYSFEVLNAREVPYFRFDPEIKVASEAMDNNSPKNIFNLKQDAYTFLSEVDHEIKKVQDLLKE